MEGRRTNRAENGLPLISQLAQEANQVPRRLGVETGGRLIQEQEKLGLARQLDADG